MLPAMQLSGHAQNFIDKTKFWDLLQQQEPDPAAIDDIIAQSLAKTPLSLEQTAALLRATHPATIEKIFNAARTLKDEVYGNRIVLFAPLYIGNRCLNDCIYCAFRRSNTHIPRRTLSRQALQNQVSALQAHGHKRLILVFGEHPDYDAEFIAQSVCTTYNTINEPGEIRRVNINAAPMDLEGFRQIKDAGIGTYQIFMETYHHGSYAKYHPQKSRKGDYLYRLDGLNRAMEAGLDDVGIGALFGLYDWRFEVLGLVKHALQLNADFGVGPHTISFPRLRPVAGQDINTDYTVSDEELKRIVAVLRLAVPYTGLILTAREPAALRKELLSFGVSQIDGGSRITLGGYTQNKEKTDFEHNEQFELADQRSLDEIITELLSDGYLPSFCTACYRLGRTGEHFMEFAIPGFIKRYCTPNAILTLMEYLLDYASADCSERGYALIENELAKMPSGPQKDKLLARIHALKAEDQRDLYF